ncbi:MAG: hypothetical protein DRJ01_18620, partial [Bacteroidetes bacterium]
KNIFKFYLLSVVLLFTACENKTEKPVEEGIIPEAKMVEIIYDLHLTDATIGIKHINKRTKTKKIVKYYSSVLKKHGYTRSQFDESIKYYSINPDKLNNIYDKVIQELSKKQELIKQEKE